MLGSPKTVTIVVTQEDIENGKPGSMCDCPVALALKHMGYLQPKVGAWFISLDGEYYDYVPSVVLSNFIQDYDMGRKVLPGRFKLKKVTVE